MNKTKRNKEERERASVQQNVYCIFAKSKPDNIHGSLNAGSWTNESC